MVKFDKDPSSLVTLLSKKMAPSRELALALAESQRTRILRRTERGKDFQNTAFAPYSTSGPYYHYPTGRTKTKKGKYSRSAATKLFKTLTGKKSAAHLGKKKALEGKEGEAWATAGGGLGFSSYGAFKRWLGRTNVDLRGIRAPHMLQAVQVKAGTANANTAEAVIGIYGDAARRAEGHNEGAKHLPKRRFLAASKADERAMAKEVSAWIKDQTK